jgi:hypothetical protein
MAESRNSEQKEVAVAMQRLVHTFPQQQINTQQ